MVTFKRRQLRNAVAVAQLEAAWAANSGYCFYQINKSAGLMMIPYVAFSAYLSFMTFCLCRDNQCPTASAPKSPRKVEKSD